MMLTLFMIIQMVALVAIGIYVCVEATQWIVVNIWPQREKMTEVSELEDEAYGC